MPAKKIQLEYIFILTNIDYHSPYLALYVVYICNNDFMYGVQINSL